MTYQQPYGYAGPPQTQVLVQPYRCSTAHVVIAWVCAVLTAGYLLPWAIAATRNRSNVAAVALIDLFLGWSLVGWVVALVMACGSDQPVVVVHQAYAPSFPPPAPQQWGPPAAQQPWGPAQPPQWTQQPWSPAPHPSSPAPQQWSPIPPHAPPALPARPYDAPEPTTVDPLGTEQTRPVPRSPWEPDHRG